ncbi:collagen alpha-1(III) chain-like isoform X2 [Psammomys obesus]|uniref:collagen alpha-1(III) chain-like isoform X2 n=1 Tax=Psammomys obesus TaxID=48139 RepID=UPI002452E699|nr:collagen alpha-1(III) chain-like isoform X2 [Psammomys obesus]
MQILRGEGVCPVPVPMAQATTPRPPRLACSPEQALTLYRLLFQRPADLGQLQAASQQVREGRDCPPGLELPRTLLQMERSRRAQEKVGAGAGEQAPGAAGPPHALVSRPPAARLGLGAAGWGGAGPLLAPLRQRLWPEGPGSACVEPARGGESGPRAAEVSQRPGCRWRDPEGLLGASFSPGVPSILQTSALRPPRQAGEAPSESRRRLTGRPATPALDEARSHAAPAPRLEGLVRPTQAVPGTPAGAGPAATGAAGPGAGCEHPAGGRAFEEPGDFDLKDRGGEDEGSGAEPNLQSPPGGRRQARQARQGQELEAPRVGKGSNSEVRGAVRGGAAAWRQEEGHPGDPCRAPGEPTAQRGEDGPPGAPRTVAAREGERAAVPAELPGPPRPRGPEGGTLAPGAPENGEQRGPGDPRFSKAAWPAPESREATPAGAQQEALQRLLDVYCAARRRRRRERERQRLRVLGRLCVVANHHRRVHPLGLPSSAALTAPQEDAAGRRRAVRERLEQVHRGRTQQLRALGARNTQSFQDLLSPGAEKPAPGE